MGSARLVFGSRGHRMAAAAIAATLNSYRCCLAASSTVYIDLLFGPGRQYYWTLKKNQPPLTLQAQALALAMYNIASFSIRAMHHYILHTNYSSFERPSAFFFLCAAKAAAARPFSTFRGHEGYNSVPMFAKIKYGLRKEDYCLLQS